MRRRLPPLPIDDHVVLGNRLKDVHEAVNRLIRPLPPTAKPVRDAVRTLKALDQLRCTLDSLICGQVPLRRDPRNLATFVYYGEERLGLRWYDPDELKNDAFAVWTPISGPRAERGRCAQDAHLSEDSGR